MKNLLVIIAIVCVSQALAGPEDVAKQRAKGTAAKLNAKQGVQPPPPPARPATTNPQPSAQPPANPAVVKLKSDFGIIINSAATAEQKKQLVTDLSAAAQGAVKPSQQTVTKLATDLSAALAGKTIASADQSRLSQDIVSIFNGAALSQTQVQTLSLDVQTILQTAGAKRTEAIVVVADLKTIAAEVQKKP